MDESKKQRLEFIQGVITLMKKHLAILIPVVAVIIAFIFSYNRAQALQENAGYTNAVIYELATRGKNRHKYLKYKFIVDGVEYEGTGNRKNSDTFSLGDNIIIIYNRTNPTRNKPKRDKWWHY